MTKPRKYRGHWRGKVYKPRTIGELWKLVKRTKRKPVEISSPTFTKKQQFNLTETDRVTYIYGITDNRKVVEVVDVSYDLKVNDEWVTVVRYDSEHGHLHRHSRIKNSEEEITTTIGVKQKGDAGEWLTWAIKDISSRYENYKTGFLKKNKDKLTSKSK